MKKKRRIENRIIAVILQEPMMVTQYKALVEMSKSPEDLSDMRILRECRSVQQVMRTIRKLD